MTLHDVIQAILFPALLNDSRLKPTDIAVYVHLFYHRLGSLTAHAKQSQISYETFRRSVRRLIQYGWAEEIPFGEGYIIVPWMPVEVEQKVADKLARVRDEAPFLGEWLMRCMLDAMVLDNDYSDNARPAWFVSGDGSGRYELDRWYRSARVAFEFQGPQHYRTGNMYVTNETELNERIHRDRLKAGICNMEGIRLIQVTPTDLTFTRLRDKLDGLLPLAPVRDNRPLSRTLEQMARSYTNYAVREDMRASKDS